MATGYLVLIDLRVRTSQTGFERRVEQTELRPVLVQSANVRAIEASVEITALKRSHNGSDAGLRGHARHTVGGGIHSVSSSFGTSDHRSHPGAGRIVCVDVNREIRVLLANAANEQTGGFRLEDTSPANISKSECVVGGMVLAYL